MAVRVTSGLHPPALANRHDTPVFQVSPAVYSQAKDSYHGKGNVPGNPMAHSMQQFVEDPDQPTRRAELAAFLGPNAESFLALYAHMAANAALPSGDRRRNALAGHGFSAPAFFLGPVWFFYRKMWLWAAGYVAAMLLIAAIPSFGQAGIGLSVAAALLARWAYLHHAIRTITAMRESAPPDEGAWLHLLAQRGGVSKPAGWISGIFFATALGLAIYQAAANR